jgi:hypothetical protein
MVDEQPAIALRRLPAIAPDGRLRQVLIGACVRTGKALGMGSEDMSSAALQLFLTGARPALDRGRSR